MSYVHTSLRSNRLSFGFVFQFLDDCTAKLNLESGARYLYDWEGNVIESFQQGMFCTSYIIVEYEESIAYVHSLH